MSMPGRPEAWVRWTCSCCRSTRCTTTHATTAPRMPPSDDWPPIMVLTLCWAASATRPPTTTGSAIPPPSCHPPALSWASTASATPCRSSVTALRAPHRGLLAPRWAGWGLRSASMPTLRSRAGRRSRTVRRYSSSPPSTPGRGVIPCAASTKPCLASARWRPAGMWCDAPVVGTRCWSARMEG